MSLAVQITPIIASETQRATTNQKKDPTSIRLPMWSGVTVYPVSRFKGVQSIYLLRKLDLIKFTVAYCTSRSSFHSNGVIARVAVHSKRMFVHWKNFIPLTSFCVCFPPVWLCACMCTDGWKDWRDNIEWSVLINDHRSGRILSDYERRHRPGRLFNRWGPFRHWTAGGEQLTHGSPKGP